MARDFISIMPTNLYGPRDNFDLRGSHVLPALIRRFHEAKLRGDAEVVGVGKRHAASRVPARRRHGRRVRAPDARFGPNEGRTARSSGGADAVNQIVNVGFGDDVSIRELAELVRHTVGFEGDLHFDHTKPDGTPRKWLDSSRLRATGWVPRIGLAEGIASTYQWFLDHHAEARLGVPEGELEGSSGSVTGRPRKCRELARGAPIPVCGV